MGNYGMGLTQHRNGVLNVQMIVNFLLLRGNMGKPGAGICPVRGHSNVQGQRTVGITEKPELAPLDKLKALYGFEPPRDKGMNTVEACEAIRAGKLQALISLGGNLVRSEPAIVAGIAKATLAPNPKVDWDAWVADYAKIRNAIAATYPQIFHDFNECMWQPGGFRKPLAAADRKWNTPTGKANFTVPDTLSADPDMPVPEDALRLFTVRSDGQFNTTIYSLEDRFRGVQHRKVLFMAGADMARLGLADGDIVTASTAVDDGIARRVDGLRVVEYGVPAGCVAGYFPECNPLIPLWHYAKESKVPAAKSVAIRVERTGGTGRALH